MTAATRIPVAAERGLTLGTGDVQFVTPGVKGELCHLHASAGLLVVDVPAPPWPSRTAGSSGGGLRQAIDMAVEQALEARGAPPPGVGDVADLDQSLSDQLYRARLVGARGLILHLPNLSASASLAAALDAQDSAVLRWWVAAVRERPVVLLLDEANRAIGAYGPPTRLDLLIKRERARGSTAPWSAVRGSILSEPALEGSGDTGTVFAGPVVGGAEPGQEPGPISLDAAPPSEQAAMAGQESSPEPAGELPASQAGPQAEDRQLLPVFPRREPAGGAAESDGAREGPDWRTCANDLHAARGPKPLTLVERLFMSRYVPLVHALASGAADDGARLVAEQWAESFARSYTEGFSALRVTGKRPRMVLDAPQLMNQIARLHGARAAQLVLVDSMRFDLGLRVHDRMCAALASQATCTERILLWAALPTTTPVQLDLLAHGAEGLATRAVPTEREEPGLQRGRTAAALRRIRVGNRDLMKLDVVESRVREAGPLLGERLDSMADEIARALGTFARSLAPRTLMFVFGDHGFRMESRAGSTLPATSGGASPDEVLVPGFAWLIGDVH